MESEAPFETLIAGVPPAGAAPTGAFVTLALLLLLQAASSGARPAVARPAPSPFSSRRRPNTAPLASSHSAAPDTAPADPIGPTQPARSGGVAAATGFSAGPSAMICLLASVHRHTPQPDAAEQQRGPRTSRRTAT